jgi:uncharacterized membrane protein YphA (DoxX/SURF4 family)
MSKGKKIIYWVSTLWLASGMLATGIQQLMKVKLEGALAPPGIYGITQLGYPVYLLMILGVWKILGVIALLIPRYPLLKEWAYAGFFFLLTGAIYSHVATNHSFVEIFPSLLLLVLLVISWFTRPAGRKLILVNNN